MSTADLLAGAAILAGAGFFLAGTVGLLRFPDTLSRLHALTKADNVGLGLVCLGLAIHDGSLAGAVLILFIWLFALLASTVSAFLIANWADPGPAGQRGSSPQRPQSRTSS